MMDVTLKTTDELKTLITNHNKHGRGSDPLCLKAQAELAKRNHLGLTFEKTTELIRAAASKGKFVSYKAIAEDSGLAWSRVRYKVFEHLGELVIWAYHHNQPLLTAVVVSQDHLASGEMDAVTLAGFTRIARQVGVDVPSDEAGFLKAEQQRVFEWAGYRA